jgi:hypothetical protein
MYITGNSVTNFNKNINERNSIAGLKSLVTNMDKDTIMIIFAIWSAVVSSIAIIGNIYKSLKDKGKLKVDCYIGVQITPGNVGKRPIIILNIGGKLSNSDFILTTMH